MQRRFIGVLASSFVLAAAAFGQTAPPTTIPKLKFKHHRLANGMQVILYVDRRSPVVHLNVRFCVGGEDERVGRTGFAHLFEHMMFEASDGASGFHSLPAPIGATEVNGATGNDATEFYEIVPSGRLERMLWLESNRFAKIPDI